MKRERLPTELAHILDGFGERLRAARIASGHPNQAEFAKKLGLSPFRYNHWEREKHPPGPHYLALMKQKFGISADWVLTGDWASLSVKLVQAMTNLGANPQGPDAAREIREAIQELPDPLKRSKRMLNEAQEGRPKRYVRKTTL